MFYLAFLGADWLVLGCCLGNKDWRALPFQFQVASVFVSSWSSPQRHSSWHKTVKKKLSLRSPQSSTQLADVNLTSLCSVVLHVVVSDGEFRGGGPDTDAGDILLILRRKGASHFKESFPQQTKSQEHVHFVCAQLFRVQVRAAPRGQLTAKVKHTHDFSSVFPARADPDDETACKMWTFPVGQERTLF